MNVIDPRNLPLKFGQNQVSNSWDIANIEFLVVGGGGWRCANSFSDQTQLILGQAELNCGWAWILTKTSFGRKQDGSGGGLKYV